MTTQKKEGFIERVDIAFLLRMTGLEGRWYPRAFAVSRLDKCPSRKGGNSLPLFLIALEKAVFP